MIAGEEVLVVRLSDRMDVGLLATLSEAQRAIVAFVLDGRTNAQIAERRGVTRRTVENQLAAAFRRLGCNSRAELIARLLG